MSEWKPTKEQTGRMRSKWRLQYRQGLLTEREIALVESIRGWTWELPDTAAENKRKLLAMPVGCKRPICGKDQLGSTLSYYTSKKNKCYDPDFDKVIRELQPQWFVDTAAENKKGLLAMPVGCERPKQKKHPLGAALSNYFYKSSSCYDPDFAKEIGKRQPQWFVDTMAENKKRLLNMPAGCERPKQGKGQFGSALSDYTSKRGKCYDPDFDRAIRELQPQWFVDTAAENKKQLLAMPAGCKRPADGKDPLGSMLGSYTRKGRKCYDPGFDRAIRELQPQWFVDTATENKKGLLALSSGCKRPVRGKDPLGLVLGRYVRKNSNCYDLVFDAAIRARQPQWFVKGVKR